ncbi:MULTISPECIES: M50 family metallopeptidase [Actinomadura]|uniref:M50 family metallopeptidase n=1 Tax=Actinomadura TaxID=1988 RepID=UPI0003AD0A32|nr:RIP metalloprotease [Actinomadura madurae]MCP9954455.1 RIP metalloprotease [Actinomadura madurae]MCP9983684.1 RIP metalloprotease [Actinomadura madurae]MCQ0004748.1 RIP metalloprotease [Actinomadura madurae]URN02118.1 RIP metalloprotease [Actinomadura madurae]SPT64441.1 Regulator of sigma E protease [Actinomadura madurae]
MAFVLGAAAFVVALLVSVMLHEGGHLLTAKRFGMKATQYFVGFGPTLWSTRRGETEYGVKAIPLGGFVKIVGYTPLEEIDPADRPRAFYRQPAGRRAVVIVAGVVANFVFAFLLLMVMAMTVGVREPGTVTSTVEEVTPCVPAAMTSDCGGGRPPSPAARAGLRAGDRVVSFGGTPVSDWDGLTRAIDDAKPGETVQVAVRRPGAARPVTLPITLADVDGRPFVGMSAKVVGAGYERTGPLNAAVFAGRGIGRTLAGIGEVVVDLPAAVPKLFTPERESTPGGQVGSVVGATDVSGQIFSSDSSARDKLALYLSLVVSVNIFLGALNVLPLLPLDGGHLAVVGYERARAGVNRIRGRPDPGTVDMTRLLPLTYLAVLVLVGFGVLLILADLFNPLRLPE